MTVIGDLVTEIKKETAANNPYYTHIPDVEMVCRGLEGLDSIIGNEKVKLKAVKQFRHILVIGAEKDDKYMESAPMMNTCLFGDPGTGKTTIAGYLALIWAGSGYLERPTKKRIEVVTETNDTWAVVLTNVFLFLMMVYMFYLLYTATENWRRSGSMKAFVAYFFLFILTFLVIFFFVVTVGSVYSSVTYTVPKSEDVEVKYMPQVVSATRGTFTGQYLGETEKRTVAFLEASRGNVIILDEAYNLCQDDRDTYGKQAAAEIVRFLSENPHALVLILAGYEDDLVTGLFRIQKGMERRFLWKFYCEGYTPEEIYQIFVRHAKDRGYTVEDERIKSLIVERSSLFRNYGGDCARLFDYSQQEYSEQFLSGKVKNRVLSYEMVLEGVRELDAINTKVSQQKKGTLSEIEKIFSR